MPKFSLLSLTRVSQDLQRLAGLGRIIQDPLQNEVARILDDLADKVKVHDPKPAPLPYSRIASARATLRDKAMRAGTTINDDAGDSNTDASGSVSNEFTNTTGGNRNDIDSNSNFNFNSDSGSGSDDGSSDFVSSASPFSPMGAIRNMFENAKDTASTAANATVNRPPVANRDSIAADASQGIHTSSGIGVTAATGAPPESSSTGFFAQDGDFGVSKVRSPNGIYLHGPVGCGKSMLMDMFYDTVPVERKSRLHYHDFVSLVHRMCHEFRASTATTDLDSLPPASCNGNGNNNIVASGVDTTKAESRHRELAPGQVPHSDDAVPAVARALVHERLGWLICFDEVQVPDPADSVVVGRTMAFMISQGAVFVATSNKSPTDLEHGLFARHLFRPYAELLLSKCDVISLDEAAIDYRMFHANDPDAEKCPIGETYFTDHEAFESVWEEACKKAGGHVERFITIPSAFGRTLEVPLAIRGDDLLSGESTKDNPAGTPNDIIASEDDDLDALMSSFHQSTSRPVNSIARFSFSELLNAPLGPSDFAAIAAQFDCVFVSGIPALNLGARDAARRLITFVDQMYERAGKVVLEAERPIDDLFKGDPTEVDVMAVDEGIVEFLSADQLESSLFTGEDEVFAFKRCLSRLAEMNTRRYWDK